MAALPWGILLRRPAASLSKKTVEARFFFFLSSPSQLCDLGGLRDAIPHDTPPEATGSDALISQTPGRIRGALVTAHIPIAISNHGVNESPFSDGELNCNYSPFASPPARWSSIPSPPPYLIAPPTPLDEGQWAGAPHFPRWPPSLFSGSEGP